MIIDTKEEASTLWKAKTFAIAIFIVLLIVVSVFVPVIVPFKFVICGLLSVAYLLFYWFQYKMEYTYLYFSNEGKNLLFRFYVIQNFSSKPRSIEISRSNFVKYDIVTSFFNKKDSLVLFQKTPKGIAKYPPISLTLLSKKQKTELKRALFAMTN